MACARSSRDKANEEERGQTWQYTTILLPDLKNSYIFVLFLITMQNVFFRNWGLYLCTCSFSYCEMSKCLLWKTSIRTWYWSEYARLTSIKVNIITYLQERQQIAGQGNMIVVKNSPFININYICTRLWQLQITGYNLPNTGVKW